MLNFKKFILKSSSEVKIFTKQNNITSVKTDILSKQLSFDDRHEPSEYSLEYSYKKKGYVFFKDSDKVIGIKEKDIEVVDDIGENSMEIDEFGNVLWRNSLNQLHRDGGLPAIEDSNGAKFWYVHGQQHREMDLPAVEWEDGSKEWWVNDQLHRAGGLPACEHVNGSKSWFVNGQPHRDGGLPAMEYVDGSKLWYVNGQRHRDGGLPAVEWRDGSKLWYVNGQRHRDGGLPAVERANGDKSWYVNGKLIK